MATGGFNATDAPAGSKAKLDVLRNEFCGASHYGIRKTGRITAA